MARFDKATAKVLIYTSAGPVSLEVEAPLGEKVETPDQIADAVAKKIKAALETLGSGTQVVALQQKLAEQTARGDKLAAQVHALTGATPSQGPTPADVGAHFSAADRDEPVTPKRRPRAS